MTSSYEKFGASEPLNRKRNRGKFLKKVLYNAFNKIKGV